VPDWRERLVCSKCGSRNIDMLLEPSGATCATPSAHFQRTACDAHGPSAAACAAHDGFAALAADAKNAQYFKDAQYFELADDARDAYFQVAQSKPSSIVSALPMTRLPYAKIWIKWMAWPGEAKAYRNRYAVFLESPDGDLTAGRRRTSGVVAAMG